MLDKDVASKYSGWKMGISARSRKLLWGRSGSRCALCKGELIKPGTPVDDESIIGDECHIVSAVPGGPRYDPDFPREKVDKYPNLLLLCNNHHKLIDDQEREYTVSYLRNLRTSHETWVSERLGSFKSAGRPIRIRQIPENVPALLPRIRTGKDLLSIVSNACAFAAHYDDLRDETEDELVACFLQEAQDWGEIGLQDVSDRIRASRSLDEHIRDLEQAGFWVFGCSEKRILEGGSSPEIDWPVAHISVHRNTDAGITVLNLGPEVS